MTFIERCAKALYEQAISEHPPSNTLAWEQLSTFSGGGMKAFYERQAAAALREMREPPTEGMIAAGSMHVCFHDTQTAREDVANVWSAMIDQALGESR